MVGSTETILRRHTSERTSPRMPSGLFMLGSGLILAGVFIAFRIAQEVLNLYQEMESNVFIGTLIAKIKDADLFVAGDDSLMITEQGATIVALAAFVLLASLGIRIATALIRSGTHIVSPTLSEQLTQLKQSVDNLRDKVDGE